MLQVLTPFFGLGQALPAEMFRGAKEKVVFQTPHKSVFWTWKSCLQTSSNTQNRSRIRNHTLLDSHLSQISYVRNYRSTILYHGINKALGFVYTVVRYRTSLGFFFCAATQALFIPKLVQYHTFVLCFWSSVSSSIYTKRIYHTAV